MKDNIILHNLTTGYKGKAEISKNLSATLRSEELTCLLGPNGAGKSTLLRTLSAFQKPLGGSIEVLGSRLSSYSKKQLSKIVSVVLTDNSGIRNMTAWEVVCMGRSPYTGFWGRLSERDKTIVKKSFQLIDIEWLKDRKMHTLSDGECQKVMIAKALAQETPIIILDEPTAYLDYPSKIQMMLLLHRLAKTLKKTIFLSTHDLEHALQIADQIWLLDPKLGLTTGSPEDLSLAGSIEKYFNREGIAFDSEHFTFNISHNTPREVTVKGNKDSIEYKLCCTALQRNGIRPTDENNDSSVSIRIPGDGTFRLVENGTETYKVEKIEHILHTVVPAIVKDKISQIRTAADLSQYE